MPYVDGFPDTDCSFGVADLAAASTAWARDPAMVSDRQLKMLATYSRDIAANGWAQREAAIAALADKHVAAQTTRPAVVAQKAAADVVTIPMLKHVLEKTYLPVIREALEVRDKRIATLEMENSALHARVAGVETKAAALEERADCGVWDESASYQKFSGVTYDGGFWFAQRDTQRGDKPGASSAWRLAVHRGKPGRDGKDLR